MNVFRYPKDTDQPVTGGPIAYYKGEDYFVGECVPKPGDTKGGFGIKDKNGEWESLNPDGGWEKRPGTLENLRSWETFYPASVGMSAPRDRNGVRVSFLFKVWLAE